MFLPIDSKVCTLTNIHPCKYYLYSYNDINGDKKLTSGDYMSSKLDNIIEIKPESNSKVVTFIDMKIP